MKGKPFSRQDSRRAHEHVSALTGRPIPPEIAKNLIKERKSSGLPREQKEHKEQIKTIVWWDKYALAHSLDRRLLFAIPNGGKRDYLVGAWLKSEGVRAGVSDLFLMIPRGQYHGCFIEMKADDGDERANQQQFIELAIEQGYLASFAYGAVEACERIQTYLESPVAL